MSRLTSKASSFYRRLQGIFSTSPDATNKPTSKLSYSAAKKDTKFEKVVRKFKEQSESLEFRNRFNVYKSTVRQLANAKRFSMIEDILEYQKKYEEIRDEKFVIRLIILYGKAGMLDHAYKLFDEMPKLKCARTVMSFNALLTACVHAKKFDKIEELLREVPVKVGIEPNLISYHIVIKAFCNMGSFDSALSLVDDLEKGGLEPNLVTFNTLLEGLYRNGLVEDGERILALMKSKNVVPDARSYNPRLRRLVYEKKIMQAAELVSEMENNGTKPDTWSYNALIKGYCDDGNLEEAMRWYNELRKSGCSPDHLTYVILVSLHCKKHNFDLALELCTEAINRRVHAGAAMFQPVIDGLVKKSKIKEAVTLLELGKSTNYFHYEYDIKFRVVKS